MGEANRRKKSDPGWGKAPSGNGIRIATTSPRTDLERTLSERYPGSKTLLISVSGVEIRAIARPLRDKFGQLNSEIAFEFSDDQQRRAFARVAKTIHKTVNQWLLRSVYLAQLAN